MWSEQGNLSYSRGSPLGSSLSSYSSNDLQQMLKIDITRPKHPNNIGFIAPSTKSSYHKLKESRASDILQTVQKFDKKYVNFSRVEEHDSSLSSLSKLSAENLPFSMKIDVNSEHDITKRKSVVCSPTNFEDKAATEKSTGKITGTIQTNVSTDLMIPSKNISKAQSHVLDHSNNQPKLISQSNATQDSKVEVSLADELSNDTVNNKPWLQVTVQAKTQNKKQLENNSHAVISEKNIKAASVTEVVEKAMNSNNEQKCHQQEQFDYFNPLQTKSDYNENKISSSSASTIHTEPSANMGSYTDTQEKKHITASLLETQAALNILPFKVLMLDDLMDESQISFKSEHGNPSKDFEEVNRDVKQKQTVKEDTFSNLMSAKQSGYQETDEEIEEILEDSEPQNNTLSMDNSSNKPNKNNSSVVQSDAENLHLESSGSMSDSPKRRMASENSEELASVRQSLLRASTMENEASSKSSVTNNSKFKEESVKTIKPQELILPKTFYSVSSQTDINYNDTIYLGLVSPRLQPSKAIHFSQETQTDTDLENLLPDPPQASQKNENESLEQISASIIVNEVLKQQIKLTKHFIEAQQRMHSAYLAAVNQLSANFKPITLEETEQYIKASLQRRHT